MEQQRHLRFLLWGHDYFGNHTITQSHNHISSAILRILLSFGKLAPTIRLIGAELA